jgi:outer membrane protein OmpA-like peptidoglycan-associated protein
VNDELDKCPTVPGLVKYDGCPVPDTDGDGINDENDKCPAEAGTAKYNGCPIPDRDGDGVNDETDACPDTKGPVSNKGCPEIKQEVIEKVNFAAKNILFRTASDQITKSSLPGLDEVVKILRADNNLLLSIDGHSDNVGNETRNLALSQKRADAVKKYLISKGINASRLEAKGYGQSRPVADNDSKEGQTANRRVEMSLIQH